MRITCPHCGQEHEIQPEFIGRTAKCIRCETEFVVQNPNLAPCPDCFELISKRATSCPRCGAPLNAGTGSAASPANHEEDLKEEREILTCSPASMYFFWELVVGIILLPIIAGIPILISAIVAMKCTVYTITTKRVLVKTGWLNKRQSEIWIKDMRGVYFQQNLWDRIIGTGSISIGTAATAGTEIQMVGLYDAQELVDQINEARKS